MRSRSSPLLVTRALRRLSAALVAMSFVIGVLQAGRAYLYCPMRDAVVTVHCCPAVRDDSADDSSPVVHTPDCCQSRQLGALPPGDGVSSPPTLGAPSPTSFVFVAPPRVDLAMTHPPAFSRPSQRAGPLILSAPARAARLGVFLI